MRPSPTKTAGGAENEANEKEMDMANDKTKNENKRSFLEVFTSLPVLRFFLNSKHAGTMVLKMLLLFPVIPYAMIWVLGFINEKIFGWTQSAGTVAIVVAILSLICLSLQPFAIIRYVTNRRKAGNKQ